MHACIQFMANKYMFVFAVNISSKNYNSSNQNNNAFSLYGVAYNKAISNMPIRENKYLRHSQTRTIPDQDNLWPGQSHTMTRVRVRVSVRVHVRIRACAYACKRAHVRGCVCGWTRARAFMYQCFPWYVICEAARLALFCGRLALFSLKKIFLFKKKKKERLTCFDSVLRKNSEKWKLLR